ncbi:MAG: chalcone isomerase family protein [Candidatus Hydrogenedentes bacterium]|nr:chalcone isomerase family protein [Candidatus Hydrogenedentota bacterium]
MRKFIGLLAVSMALAAVAVAEYKEPKTGAHFDSSLQIGESTVECTGVDYRSKWTFKVYGIAHYGDPANSPGDKVSAREKRAYWIQATAAKAFVLKFVRSVDGETIRDAWSEAMRNAEYSGPNGESLLKAFRDPVEEGETIAFTAAADGTLAALKNGEKLGEWKDPALVRALWATWLGKNPVINDADKLVAYAIRK